MRNIRKIISKSEERRTQGGRVISSLRSNKIGKPKNIPKSPGIYVFRAKDGRALYVGKAGNLKTRLAFYFRKEAARQPRTARLLDEAARVSIVKAESEIEALVKEAEFIKSFRPKYNILMRDDKNYLFVVVSREDFPRIILTHQPKAFGRAAKIIGPFTDSTSVKTTLKMLRRVFPYCTCKAAHKGLCLNAEIGKCPGFCCTKPMNQKELRFLQRGKAEYRKSIRAVVSILEGKKIRALKKEIKTEIAKASSALKYERAATLRDQLYGLEAIILHRPIVARECGKKEIWPALEEKIKFLLKINFTIRRVEGYDISNISGVSAGGSMVVFTNGAPDKKEYRKFRIKSVEGANDVAMLAEIISRRFRHKEWKKADLIILDGGKPQLNAAADALKFQIPKSKIQTLMVALAKRDEELYIAGRKNPIQLKKQTREILHFFQRVRDEAHRFAKKYHHKLREKNINE